MTNVETQMTTECRSAPDERLSPGLPLALRHLGFFRHLSFVIDIAPRLGPNCLRDT